MASEGKRGTGYSGSYSKPCTNPTVKTTNRTHIANLVADSQLIPVILLSLR